MLVDDRLGVELSAWSAKCEVRPNFWAGPRNEFGDPSWRGFVINDTRSWDKTLGGLVTHHEVEDVEARAGAYHGRILDRVDEIKVSGSNWARGV